MVNKSMITQTDIEATNGVVHVIDTVLVPSDFTLQEVDMEEATVAKTGLESSAPILVAMLVTAGAIIFMVIKKKEA